jgi:hypothetical protein
MLTPWLFVWKIDHKPAMNEARRVVQDEPTFVRRDDVHD